MTEPGQSEQSVDLSDSLRLVQAFQAVGHSLTSRRTTDLVAAIADLAIELLPGAEWASITELKTGKLVTTAATHDAAMQGDRMQYELGTGPCVDAVLSTPVTLIADTRTTDRWPTLAQRVHQELGVRSMLSFRLVLDESDLIGGLNLYATKPESFSEQDVTQGHLLAAHASLAVAAAAARDQAANLEVALKSNRRIGAAIGVLMYKHKLTYEQSFDLLRIASQRQHRKLVDLAEDVLLTGEVVTPGQAG